MHQTSRKFPRFGYRRIAAIMGENHKRIYRLWRQENLQLPKKRPKRRKISSTESKLLKSMAINHVWSYDFISDRCANGQKLKILCVVDKHTKECLALEVASSIWANHLIDTLSRLMTIHGRPQFIRSDNGPEFTATALIKWLREERIGSLFIKPGSPWENGYIESFNGKFRDECLNREWFLNRQDAKKIIEEWRIHYNNERPHSALGYLPPAQVSSRNQAA